VCSYNAYKAMLQHSIWYSSMKTACQELDYYTHQCMPLGTILWQPLIRGL